MEIQRDNNTDNSTVLKLRDGNVSPNNTPRDHNLVTGARYRSTSDYSPLMKYLLSGQLSKDCRTPPNRQMIGYQHNKSGLSGNNSGFSSHGSSSPLSVFTLPAVDGMERLPLRSQLSQAVKIDEDVLVMDGILVGSVAGEGRLRHPATSDSGRSLSSSYSSGGSLYKSEICRFWEASGTCHFGLKCQFAHGKEELRLTHFANRNTAEVSIGKPYSSHGPCTYGPRHCFAHKAMSTPPVKGTAGASTALKVGASSQMNSKQAPSGSPIVPSRGWSPLDDGIEVKLPSSTAKAPSREAVDKHINSVLYGPTRKKRLPIFVDFCPR